MATVIRLTRRGRMHAPFYRIGVFDSRTRRDGASIENLGFYNPLAEGEVPKLELNAERTRYWLSVGAKPSETVASFFAESEIEYNPAAVRTAKNKKRSAKRIAAEKKSGKIHGKAKQKQAAAAKAAK